MKTLVRSLLMLWAAPVLLAQAQPPELQIEVTAGAERAKVMLAKPTAETPFPEQERILQELYELFEFDLNFSGAFVCFTESESPEARYQIQQDRESGTIDYDAWRELTINDLAMDYLVEVALVPRGPDSFAMNVLVYDLVRGNRVIGRAYGGEPHQPFPADAIRRAGHKATAGIISALSDIEPITETQIAFSNYDKANSTREIYLIDYDGWRGSLTQVTSFDSVTLFPDWSSDGNHLTYASMKSGWSDCFVQTLSTGEVTPVAAYKGTNTTPRFIPDSLSLVASLSAWGDAEISRISMNGEKPTRITNHPGADISPDPSPDGNRLAFTSDRSGNPQIYVSNLDGSNLQRITYIDNGRQKCDTPNWSPVPIDGDYRIAFHGFFFSLQSNIFTIRPDGSDVQQLTDDQFDNKNPSWSPNGRFIAMSSNRLGKYDVFIIPAQGGRLPNGEDYHRVTYMAGDNLYPAWSPN